MTAVRDALARAGAELETACALLEREGAAASVKLSVRLAAFEVRAAIVALDAPIPAELTPVVVLQPVAVLNPASGPS